MGYRWSEEKDRWLRENRHIGFKEIVDALNEGRMLADVANPSRNFPHQRAYIVEFSGYAIVVPYVRDGDDVFLKTLYPDRKMRRRYLG